MQSVTRRGTSRRPPACSKTPVSPRHPRPHRQKVPRMAKSQLRSAAVGSRTTSSPNARPPARNQRTRAAGGGFPCSACPTCGTSLGGPATPKRQLGPAAARPWSRRHGTLSGTARPASRGPPCARPAPPKTSTRLGRQLPPSFPAGRSPSSEPPQAAAPARGALTGAAPAESAAPSLLASARRGYGARAGTARPPATGVRGPRRPRRRGLACRQTE
mmetsp:Transcript_41236/g.131027  ORF Transcript_41236/g.131027 Transcript_41236/m.131027 type:complete len:216 (+) Transcript_41236:257-904(+)